MRYSTGSKWIRFLWLISDNRYSWPTTIRIPVFTLIKPGIIVVVDGKYG